MKKRKMIYIAGPMSGIKDFNFPAFFEAQTRFEALDYFVFNPAAKDIENHPDIQNNPTGDQKIAAEKDGFNLRDAMIWDTHSICQSDAIYMLRGWEKSKGAFAEWALAKALDLEIMYQ